MDHLCPVTWSSQTQKPSALLYSSVGVLSCLASRRFVCGERCSGGVLSSGLPWHRTCSVPRLIHRASPTLTDSSLMSASDLSWCTWNWSPWRHTGTLRVPGAVTEPPGQRRPAAGGAVSVIAWPLSTCGLWQSWFTARAIYDVIQCQHRAVPLITYY